MPAVVADDLPPPPTVTTPPTPLEESLIGGWDLDRSSGRFANDPAPRRGVAFSQAQRSVLENYRDWVTTEGFGMWFSDGDCNGNGGAAIIVGPASLKVDKDSALSFGRTAIGCGETYPQIFGEISACLRSDGCRYAVNGDQLMIVGAEGTEFRFNRSAEQ